MFNSISDTIKIPLSQEKFTIISAIDADLAQRKWYAALYGKFYAVREDQKRTTKMHRLIMERILGRPLAKNEIVDHIDNDSLNNRRDNLRIANQAQNCQNRKRHSNNKSGYKGVYKDKRTKSRPWQARITVAKKTIRLGSFSTAEEAYAAYCEAAIKYFGEFARLK